MASSSSHKRTHEEMEQTVPLVDFNSRVIKCDNNGCQFKGPISVMVSIESVEYCRFKICFDCFNNRKPEFDYSEECQSCHRRFCKNGVCYFEDGYYCRRCLFDDRIIHSAFHVRFDEGDIDAWRSRSFLSSEITPEVLARCDCSLDNEMFCRNFDYLTVESASDAVAYEEVLIYNMFLHILNDDENHLSEIPQVWKDRISAILTMNKAYYATDKELERQAVARLLKTGFPKLSDELVMFMARRLMHYPGAKEIVSNLNKQFDGETFFDFFVEACRYMFEGKRKHSLARILKKICSIMTRRHREKVYEFVSPFALLPIKPFKDMSSQEFFAMVFHHYTNQRRKVLYQDPLTITL